MVYRLYTPEDFDALYAIEEACFRPPLRFGRRYMRQLVERPNAATWIAEDAERMYGFGLVEWTREIADVTAYIQTLEVMPDGRGQGVGGELLRRLESSAWVAGAAGMWLHVDAANSVAIQVYERHGYRLSGREKDYYGRGKPALVYAKRLHAEQRS